MTTAVADTNRRARRKLKWIFGGGATALWMLALALPAYSDGTPGVVCLLFGWAMVFDNTFAFLAWFSNLPLIIGALMLFFGKRKKVVVSAAILCAASTLLSFGAFTVTALEEASTGILQVVHASGAAYLWVFSHVLMLIGAVLCIGKAKVQ
jgi:uncharacterized membrane protein